MRSGKPVSFEEQLSGGQVVRVSYRPLLAGGWLASYEDVTERQKAQAQVAFLARHDPLTRLANRVLFHDRLHEALIRIGTVAVLYLDLDRFKDVNDTLGHPVGDVLLRLVSGRLTNCFRQTDTVARLGGDEFAVILSPGSRDSAATAARHVIEVVGRTFELDGHEISIGTSVGIALAPDDGNDPDTLLKNADLALYAAKADGRAAARFFECSMIERLQARRSLENDLRSAVANQELQLFYQPLVSARSGTAAGIEALLRWRHPVRGMVPPSEFIPVAEATRLIIPLGAWSLRRACQDAVRLPEHLRISVNLSAIQLRSQDLVRTVREVLANFRHVAAPAGAGGDGVHADPRCRRGTRSVAGAARPGGADRDGRLRHGLFLAVLHPQFPLRPDQDRQVLRGRSGTSAGFRRDHPRGHRHSGQPGDRDGG